MDPNTITYEEFQTASRNFIEISNRLCDGWKIHENLDKEDSLYLRKEDFVRNIHQSGSNLLGAEFVISYSNSYNVPLFAFNYWKSGGALVPLNEIKKMSTIKISESDFFSTITQQEHPLFFRPFYIIHPCRTAEVLAAVRKETTNLLVTFISLVSPLISFNLPLEYAMS